VASTGASPRSEADSTLRGDLQPRVDVHPPYQRTLAEGVIAVARLAGLELDFWQQQALVTLCSVREDGKWAAFEYLECVARQNGKGGILEARVLAGLFLFDERLILWSAHEYKTSMEAFRRVDELLRKMGTSINQNLIAIDDGEGHTIMIKVHNTNGEESFERLDTRQRLKFVARSKGSGRGFSGDLIIIDEAMFYTATQHAALLFALSARPNPQIIYTSTPPLDGDSGEQLFDLQVRAEDMLKGAEAAAEEALAVRIWGAEGDLDHLDRIDLDDPRNVQMANPALNIRVTMETVRRERRSLRANGGLEFARERLGIWPLPRSMAGGVIDRELWATLQDPESKRAGDVAIGVRIAPERDYAAVALYGPGEDGNGHARLIARRAGTAWIVPMLVTLRDELDPIAIGMNTATFASLEAGLSAEGFLLPETPSHPWRGELLVINATDSAAACGHLIDAVRDMTFRVRPDPEHPEVLDDAVLAAKTRRVGDAIAWSSKEDEAEISPVGALTDARFTYISRSEALETETLEGSLMA
jgi:hypothetical protein